MDFEAWIESISIGLKDLADVSVDEDNDGQLVVYTNRKKLGEKVVVFDPEEQ